LDWIALTSMDTRPPGKREPFPAKLRARLTRRRAITRVDLAVAGTFDGLSLPVLCKSFGKRKVKQTATGGRERCSDLARIAKIVGGFGCCLLRSVTGDAVAVAGFDDASAGGHGDKTLKSSGMALA
jgi:hypothetical protein